jgi:Ca-activated chloride channel family protein
MIGCQYIMMERGNKMLKNLKKLMILLIILMGVLQSSNVFAVTQQNSNVNAVLIIDVSGSMKQSDPSKLGFEGVKMFIDMCSYKGDNIGVVAYSNTVEKAKNITPINTQNDKDIIKSFVSSLNRESSYTDITAGLNKATEMLDSIKGQNTNKPMIVVFTDGNNDIQTNGNRKYSDIQNDLNNDLAKAKKGGYPIYTIGLNADNKLNKNYLQNISNATNAKSFITTNASQLPSILSQIFADNLKLKILPVGNITANGKVQYVNVNIPNSNVVEANISIMSNKPVQVGLSDPKGVTHKIPSSDVIYTKANTYSMLKILNPQMGNWKLSLKGIAGNKINVNLIYNYNLSLEMEPLSSKSYKKGDSVDVKAVFKNNGTAVTDPKLYASMTAKVILKDLNDNTQKEFPIKNTGKSFEGSFNIPDSQKYSMKISAEDKSFNRETPEVIIDALSGKVISTSVPGTTPKPDTDKKISVITIILIILGIIIALALAAFAANSIRKKNKKLFGQIVIEVRDENTGKLENPEYKKLNVYKGKVTMHQLLQLKPEFKETEKMVFYPGSNDKLILKNKSNCEIQKSGRLIKAETGYELSKNDKLKIILKDATKTITIEFIY